MKPLGGEGKVAGRGETIQAAVGKKVEMSFPWRFNAKKPQADALEILATDQSPRSRQGGRGAASSALMREKTSLKREGVGKGQKRR